MSVEVGLDGVSESELVLVPVLVPDLASPLVVVGEEELQRSLSV